MWVSIDETTDIQNSTFTNADNTIFEEKDEATKYAVQIYTDGSKTQTGVGAGIAIFYQDQTIQQHQYKLHNKCSNTQAERVAILKALEILNSTEVMSDKTAAVHTDSRITLDLLRNNRKYYPPDGRNKDQLK